MGAEYVAAEGQRTRRNAMKRLATILTILGLTLSGLLASTTTASAGPPRDDLSCGATITADTTLRRDLVNCPGLGLVIGADHVTLDLNGHVVDGDAVPTPTCPSDVPCDVGVSNPLGFDDVTIRGGSIREFGTGVFLLGADGNRLQDLQVSRSLELGTVVVETNGTVITDSEFDRNGTSGLVVVRSRDVTVTRNEVTGSRGFGVFTADLVRSRIKANELDQNDHGLAVFGESTQNFVLGNRVTRSNGSAIDLGGGSRNRVESNRLADNGDGIILTDEERTLVSGNRVTGSGTYGYPDTGGFGVILDGADDNVIRRNRVAGGRGPAILVTKLDSPTTADGNRVVGNVAHSRASDGILIGEGATGTSVRRNVASGNGDDGIDVDAPSTEVTRNSARRNADLGIESVAGVRDGGGNRASGNGDPRQCTTVVCGS
jgi:parallel beta-helix repeat protein